MRKIFGIILIKVNRANIKALVTWPIVIGLIFLVGSLLIGEKIYSKVVPDTYISVIGMVSAFMFSLSGFFQIFRREGPGVLGTVVKGIWPVLIGVIWVVFTWTLGLFLLYQIF